MVRHFRRHPSQPHDGCLCYSEHSGEVVQPPSDAAIQRALIPCRFAEVAAVILSAFEIAGFCVHGDAFAVAPMAF